jgi:hypothetical protein
MVMNMNKWKVLFLSVVFYFSAGCQDTAAIISKEKTPIWGDPSNGLRVSIAVQEPQLILGDPAGVSVIIHNISEDKKFLQTIPAFTMSGQYWCPVDIIHEGSNLPANARVIIALEKDSSISERVDISKLKCDKEISSQWPEQTLFEAIPRGRYLLRLEIEIIGENEKNWIYSNKVEIEISH